MRRSEAEHVLRAAAAIAQEQSFVIVGSQAVLFLLPDAPQALLVSRELDLYPALHPEKADLIDGAIGALSSFDDTFGYHADGVGPETAVMPADWMDRAFLLRRRIGLLDAAKHPHSHVIGWVERRYLEAQAKP